MVELTGAIKNALERGQNFNQVRQSLLTAGYEPAKVSEALQEFGQYEPSTPQQSAPISNTTVSPMTNLPQQPIQNNLPMMNAMQQPYSSTPQNYQPMSTQQVYSSVSTAQTQPAPHIVPQTFQQLPSRIPQNKFPKWLVIMLILVSLGIFIGAAIIGLTL